MSKNESPQNSAELTIEGLTQEVGTHVRSIRSRRGLTRKNLAQHSEVSKRYLTQLEQGTANISLALLWRIANARGAHRLTAANSGEGMHRVRTSGRAD
ncbi:MAG: helix-turn-helix domain-containing protein [Sedimenticola sp.]